MTILSEEEARAKSVCVCGRPKTSGCVVCRDCFKYREDIEPLKYYTGSFEEWQIFYKGLISVV